MSREASASPSKLPFTLLNAFSQIMQEQPNNLNCDQCRRPRPTYNFNYNPHKPPCDDLPKGYSPYTFKEPLYNNREVIRSRLPHKHTLCATSKRQKTA
jgi:hypothetical protein